MKVKITYVAEPRYDSDYNKVGFNVGFKGNGIEGYAFVMPGEDLKSQLARAANIALNIRLTRTRQGSSQSK